MEGTNVMVAHSLMSRDNQQTVLVLDVFETASEAHVSGVLVDPVRAADLSFKPWVAWIHGKSPRKTMARQQGAGPIVVPAMPPGETLATYYANRLRAIEEKLVLHSVQNLISLTLEDSVQDVEIPFFLSTEPCGHPRRLDVEVEMLIDSYADTADFKAFADFLYEMTDFRNSLRGLGRSNLLADVIKRANSSALSSGLHLPFGTGKRGGLVGGVLTLCGEVRTDVFRARVDMIMQYAMDPRPGDVLSRKVQWQTGTEFKQTSADVARILSISGSTT